MSATPHAPRRDPSPATTPSATNDPVGASPYARYALAVLVLVYVFNFVDRQILSILNESIKADLGVTDAQMGFLYGTAFAVFYAVFGIPLGRLADVWVRRKMIAIGLFFWSLMTALSGTARGFTSLAAFRIGVGIGEASASPAAYSMLGDYFPPRLRATAFAVYSSGVYIGAGIGMLIGGRIVPWWNAHYPDAAAAPLGLAGWQAAFFAVGLPGLVMALWTWTLREPSRGGRAEAAGQPPSPLPVLARELAVVVPPFTLFSLAALGGRRVVAWNLLAAALCAGAAWGMSVLVGSPAQWIALALGVHAFCSWVQALALRDRAAYVLIFHTPSLVFGVLGFSCCAFVTYGAGYWTAPFFIRVHGESMASVGTVIGLTTMLAGWFGVTVGGVLSDWLRARHPLARPWCGVLTAAVAVPAAILTYTVGDTTLAYAANVVFTAASSLWIGSAIALANELVLPRMRATTSAIYLLSVTFVGLALGPFTVGRISTSLEAAGATAGEALRSALLCGLGGYGATVLFLLLALRTLAADEAGRDARARALGEAT